MSNTMAEAFCEEHLMTWMEHGEDFTDWRDGDTFTNLHRMTQAGAVTLFQPMGKNGYLKNGYLKNGYFMIVTVFRDRSWMIHEEPTGGAPILVGTGEDEHRILDFIHQMLEAGEEPEPPEFPTYLDTQGNEHAEF